MSFSAQRRVRGRVSAQRLVCGRLLERERGAASSTDFSRRANRLDVSSDAVIQLAQGWSTSSYTTAQFCLDGQPHFGVEDDPSNRSPLALQQPSKSGRRRMGAAKHQLPQAGLHARCAVPRVSHDSPYLPLNPRDAHSPPSTAATSNAESRAHHPNSRPPRRPTTALGSPADPSHEGRGPARRLRRRNQEKTSR